MYKLGVLNMSTDAASDSAATLPFTEADLLFWQDAGHFELALPNYAPYAGPPNTDQIWNSQIWAGGQEVYVFANDGNVFKEAPGSGPFAGRKPYRFTNYDTANIALPFVYLGQSYSLFIPFAMEAFPATSGGIFGHADTAFGTNYLETYLTNQGGISVNHGAASAPGNSNYSGSGAYSLNQVNLAVIIFDAIGTTVNGVSGVGAMTSYIYGMSGASLKLSPLHTAVLGVAPKNQVGYNIGNIGGGSCSFLLDDFVAMNTAVNTQNPILFNRMIKNYAAKYGLSTTP